jgi:hypothetical protein
VGRPTEVGRDGDAQVFRLVNSAEGVAMELKLIGAGEWVSLPADA